MDDLERRRRCREIANQVEPRYLNGSRSYTYGSSVGQRWYGAWGGAYIALGGDPADSHGLLIA